MACAPTWSSGQWNVHSTGGQLVPGYFSPEQCRNYCAYDATKCVGVDVDYSVFGTAFNYTKCWIHTATMDGPYGGTDVQQFQLLKPAYCPSTTAASSTQTC